MLQGKEVKVRAPCYQKESIICSIPNFASPEGVTGLLMRKVGSFSRQMHTALHSTQCNPTSFACEAQRVVGTSFTAGFSSEDFQLRWIFIKESSKLEV